MIKGRLSRQPTRRTLALPAPVRRRRKPGPGSEVVRRRSDSPRSTGLADQTPGTSFARSTPSRLCFAESMHAAQDRPVPTMHERFHADSGAPDIHAESKLIASTSLRENKRPVQNGQPPSFLKGPCLWTSEWCYVTPRHRGIA